MDNHFFCRELIKDARENAKEQKVKIPRISTSKMWEDNYAVFIGDDFDEEFNECCAFYSRAKAINSYVKREVKKRTNGNVE